MNSPLPKDSDFLSLYAAAITGLLAGRLHPDQVPERAHGIATAALQLARERGCLPPEEPKP